MITPVAPRAETRIVERACALALVALLAGCAANLPAPVEDRAAGRSVPAPAAPEAVPGSAPPAAARTFPAPDDAPREAMTRGAQDTAPGDAMPPAASAGATPPPAPAANPAVVALLNRANQDANSGRHDTAAASLERAIKIEPGNAWLWHRLAATRLEQGRPGEAAALAARSTALAAGDPALQAQNWRLIARVHRGRGEEVAARAAEQRARELAANPS